VWVWGGWREVESMLEEGTGITARCWACLIDQLMKAKHSTLRANPDHHPCSGKSPPFYKRNPSTVTFFLLICLTFSVNSWTVQRWVFVSHLPNTTVTSPVQAYHWSITMPPSTTIVPCTATYVPQRTSYRAATSFGK
jgi:hypothetical protein